jgi:hypothetical protein
MTAAELEIALHRRDAESYHVDLRFHQPGSDADVRLANRELSPLRLDPAALLRAADPAAYGRELAQRLFADTNIATALATARAVAASNNAPLRVRLFIGPSAPELHNLRWETLLDPATDPALATPLLTNQTIVFSRYLSSLDWRPIRLRPKRVLTALVVIASPNDSAQWGLATIDVAQELATARAGLAGITCTEVAAPGAATLETILQHLRDEVDILYLVAHGKLQADGEPLLYLESNAADKVGKTTVVAGSELVTRLQELTVRPRLIVLASCQSAGAGAGDLTAQDQGALAALGPRLAEAGIPAVLAMQGNISMATVQQFMPSFFAELQRDGQIDRALAVARGQVRQRPDWWMPVLFMRLKSGRIWYVPGFGEQQDPLEKWEALIESIKDEECTPILGPGLMEFLYGDTQGLASRLAEMHYFPLAPHEREDLAQVAQYLSIKQSRRFLMSSILRLWASEIQQQHKAELPGELALRALEKGSTKQLADTLAELISTVVTKRRAKLVAEPFQTLARLPFPIYITTDTSDLLADALKEAGKAPEVELCRWNKEIERIDSVYEREPGYRPTLARPLVFHLFGHIRYPRSLVLTEDDYFDYLIGATSNKDLIPATVRRRLADTALLFLGFQMEERNFRVLFRSIMRQEGSASLGQYDAHIAAQVTPEEGRLLEPTSAQKFLEKYFQQNGKIDIYWGNPETFLHDLHQRWV